MELFPSLKASMESSKSTLHKDEYRATSFSIVEYEVSTILNKISNIDTLDEKEIKSIITRQHKMLLNYDLFLASSKSRKEMQALFTNKRFLTIFLDVIGLIELDRHEIICINKLAYDYYIMPTKDSEVSRLLLQISRVINNILTIKLSAILGIENSKILAMFANSSFKEEKNIHRINTFLVRCNLDLNVQDMVNIYCILYESFSNLFTYTMLEPKPSGMSPEQLKRFDNISLAMLYILDSMNSHDMKMVLYNYAFTLRLIRQNFKVRFGLKTATSYTRMLGIIDEIENDPLDKLIIP